MTVAEVADAPACTGVPAVEPTYGVTVYPVTELPPSLLGTDQLTSAWLVAGLADTDCGADGTPAPVGVTAFDGADAEPAPAELDACTTNVYDVPAVRPTTVVLVVDPDTVVGVCALDPIYGVIVYVLGAPPLDGADHDTDALPLPAVAATPVTYPGAVNGVGANCTSTQ